MRQILVIQTASIGDVILATPVLEALHDRDSSDAIDFLVKKGNEELFFSHPFIRKVHIWDKSRSKYKNLLTLIRIIRRQKYDLVINLQRFFTSGLITVLSGAGFTTGFDKNPWSGFFSLRIPHLIGDPELHEADRNLSLIPDLHIPKGLGHIRLYPSEKDKDRIRELQDSPYVCLAPASLWYTKQFPLEKWIELMDGIPASLQIFLLGSHSDTALMEVLIGKTKQPNVKNLAGRFSLLESAALMKGSVMNVVNDSAPLHLCSAMEAPVVAVFCSTVPSFGFGPYGKNGMVVETGEKLKCRPCGLHGLRSCPEGHFRCATTIDVHQILNHIL